MFYDNKYTRWYHHIINRAQSQSRKKLQKGEVDYVYYESHHIVPKSFGGTETVLLTAREHFVCHALLTKMCVSTKHIFQMYKAFDKLRLKNKYQTERYFNARLYERLKTSFVYPECVKEKQRSRVNAYDSVNDCFINVTKEQFDNDDTLVGVNTGKRGAKRPAEFSNSRKGKGNTFHGKKHSTETKAIIGAGISAKLKGKPKSEAHKQAMKDAWARRKGTQ